METIDEVRAQVRRRLKYDYPGNLDDKNKEIDTTWINKKKKHEVDYAIAKRLCDNDATNLATNTTFIQKLERVIHEMEHDKLGRCKREDAYHELDVEIILEKYK